MYGRFQKLGRQSGRWSVAVGVLFLVAPAAYADLLSYEGFDYPDGNLGAATGGTGWGAAWGDDVNDAAVHTDHTLTYQDSNGADLITSGKGAAIKRTSREASRVFDQTHAGLSDDVLWFSVLFQSTLNTFPDFDAAENEYSIELRESVSNTTRFQIEKNEENNNLLVSGQGTSVDTGTSAITDAVHYFVVRYDFGTGVDDGSIHVFLNPELDAEPALGSAWASLTNLITADMAFNQIRFTAAPGNFPSFNTQFRFDEIRLGNEYADVSTIPEPASVVALTLGGAGLLLGRKRSA